jgi:hypothetical protein
MVFGSFPKKNRNKTFYFDTKKKYGCILFLLSFGLRVDFQGKKLIFWQKKITTLFISLKVTPSTQEPPKKI